MCLVEKPQRYRLANAQLRSTEKPRSDSTYGLNIAVWVSLCYGSELGPVGTACLPSGTAPVQYRQGKLTYGLDGKVGVDLDQLRRGWKNRVSGKCGDRLPLQ